MTDMTRFQPSSPRPSETLHRLWREIGPDLLGNSTLLVQRGTQMDAPQSRWMGRPSRRTLSKSCPNPQKDQPRAGRRFFFPLKDTLPIQPKIPHYTGTIYEPAGACYQEKCMCDS